MGLAGFVPLLIGLKIWRLACHFFRTGRKFFQEAYLLALVIIHRHKLLRYSELFYRYSKTR